FDNLLWQAWGRRSLVPVERLQIIAHKLFIETRRAFSDGVLVLRPEAGRIRRKAFVDQEQTSVDRAKLKFCIRDDDAGSRSVIAATRINFQTQHFDSICDFFTENLSTPFHVDVLIMPCFRFRRRREHPSPYLSSP